MAALETLATLHQSQSFQLFAQKWHNQLRLLLSILVTTGMRLEEDVAITWDRDNDTD